MPPTKDILLKRTSRLQGRRPHPFGVLREKWQVWWGMVGLGVGWVCLGVVGLVGIVAQDWGLICWPRSCGLDLGLVGLLISWRHE